jgi:hypothetical protein
LQKRAAAVPIQDEHGTRRSHHLIRVAGLVAVVDFAEEDSVVRWKRTAPPVAAIGMGRETPGPGRGSRRGYPSPCSVSSEPSARWGLSECPLEDARRGWDEPNYAFSDTYVATSRCHPRLAHTPVTIHAAPATTVRPYQLTKRSTRDTFF